MAEADPARTAKTAGMIGRLRQRLAARPDSEHEQALIRIAFTFVIAAYIVAASPAHADPPMFLRTGLAISGIALLLALAVFAHILVHPGVSVPRRVFGMLIDTVGVSGVMLVGGMTAAPFYPILLWIIFGHGFRYGRPYLFASAAVSLLSFGLVVLVNPDWRERPGLDAALILALIVLPAYVSALLGKLEQAIRRAEAANLAKSRFLAVMSHEFRTPLNAVIGLSELLRQDERDQDRHEMLGTIRTAAGTILGLIDAILDAARIEAGKLTLVARPFDLHGLLGVLRGMLEPQARARGLELRLVLDPGVHPFLSGDAPALQQVLANLVANALKFTEQGGVTLRVTQSWTQDGRDGIGFSVEDTGIGIPPALQARIFDSFTQAEDGTNRAYGGTGLGLTIAKELVELMGGRLALDSAQGRGARFSFVVPLPPAPAEGLPRLAAHGTVVVLGQGQVAARAQAAIRAAGFAAQPASEPGTALVLLRRGQGRRLLVLAGPAHQDQGELLALLARRIENSVDIVAILPPDAEPRPDTQPEDLVMASLAEASLERDLPVLVRAALAPPQDQPPDRGRTRAACPARLLVAEDNQTNQQVARRILERAGHEVMVAGSGQEAVDRVIAERFDLVLMDLNMPGMDGIAALKLLRFCVDEPPPVVALTADVTQATIEACQKAGFSDHAAKPIDSAALLGLIDRLLAAQDPPPPRKEPAAPASPSAAQPMQAPPDPSGPDDAGQAQPMPQAAPEPPGPRPVLSLASAGARRPVLDRRKLEGLVLLDQGDGFIEELVDTFVAEAGDLVAAIEQAALGGDIIAMRDHAHALRSSAAHVGATQLFDVLLGWRSQDDATLLRRGPAEVQHLRLELERASAAFMAWRADHRSARLADRASTRQHG